MAIDSPSAPSEWDRAGEPPAGSPDVDVAAGTSADAVALGPFGERSLAWWGMVMAIVTEATLFALLLFAYVYLRTRADQWPPAGIEEPELFWTGLRSILLLGSSVPVQLAEHAFVHGRRRAALRYLAIGWLMAAVFMVGHVIDVHHDWSRFRPSTNAYGSIFYLVTNLHALHLVIGLSFLGFVFVRIVQGSVHPRRHDALTVTVMYWHFVDVVWIAVFGILYLSVSW